ncbi:MAG: ABC transporter ATP-binding protein [Alphaproteobacteria bacterium]|nr:ABC transporter ATP-binding protein [Alphaproteobacteria bacterium]
MTVSASPVPPGPLLDVAELAKRFVVGSKRGLVARALSFSKPAAPPSLLHAVDDVSFTVGRGETVGLVGESGCGKSTLVRLINRLLDPTSGSIRLGGAELSDFRASSFAGNPHRARIQMVFQDAGDSLNPRYTAADAIADPLRRLKRMSGAQLKARVEALADMTGLPRELLPRFPHQLSGGQKARVGIARAIAVSPELLILDEPTAALDVSVQVVILQLLQQLKRELGMSYLFVSHDLNVVRLLCDRVLVMYLGKIVEHGPAAEVFANPSHPYTRALISAIPQADPERRVDRLRLGGEPRSPIDPNPNVCRFYGRCPKGTPRCAEEMPLLRPAGAARQVACHFA